MDVAIGGGQQGNGRSKTHAKFWTRKEVSEGQRAAIRGSNWKKGKGCEEGEGAMARPVAGTNRFLQFPGELYKFLRFRLLQPSVPALIGQPDRHVECALPMRLLLSCRCQSRWSRNQHSPLAFPLLFCRFLAHCRCCCFARCSFRCCLLNGCWPLRGSAGRLHFFNCFRRCRRRRHFLRGCCYFTWNRWRCRLIIDGREGNATLRDAFAQANLRKECHFPEGEKCRTGLPSPQKQSASLRADPAPGFRLPAG